MSKQANDQSFKQYLESSEFQQFIDALTIELADELKVPLWLLTSHEKAHAMLFRVKWHKNKTQKLITYEPMRTCTQMHIRIDSLS